jgi:hypothetical protein
MKKHGIIIVIIIIIYMVVVGCASAEDIYNSHQLSASVYNIFHADDVSIEEDIVDYTTDDPLDNELYRDNPLDIATASIREIIISIAMAQAGYGPNEVGKTLGRYPYRLRRYLRPGEAWCSEFVSWVYKAAGGPFTDGYKLEWMLKSSEEIRRWFKRHRTFVSRKDVQWNTFYPKPGDYIRYQYASGGHSGIVSKCEGSTLYTIEGNVNNMVVLRTIDNWRSRSDIDGIGLRRKLE